MRSAGFRRRELVEKESDLAASSSVQSPKRIRAFIALEPPPEWKQELGNAQAQLKARLRGSSIRWIDPAQIHITLRFLGWVFPAEAEEVGGILKGTCEAFQPFSVSCAEIGCFPSVKRPRVIWAGINAPDDTLQRLHGRITEETRSIGEPPEDRPFSPHLTLGRVKQFERDGMGALERAREFRIQMPWRMDQVLLMQSHLSPQGAEYERISSCGLGGDG
jgi:2'-5' RNA ligase